MGTVVVRYYPRRTEVLILSTNQRMACVARTCWYPFRGLSNPTEEYCEISTAQYGSIRIPPTFGGFNATRAAPLHTEPTCTHRWKCTITYQFSPVPYRPVPVLDWFIPYRPRPGLVHTLPPPSCTGSYLTAPVLYWVVPYRPAPGPLSPLRGSAR